MPIRVLLVDDSILTRRVLSKVLGADGRVDICGTAPDGRAALQKIARLKPDLVVLDVEMPVMNGLETLVELRRDHPKLPVVMFSALTRPGVQTTLDALLAGASDYVLKPTGETNVVQQIQQTLLPKILLHGGGAARRSVVRETPEERSDATPAEVAPERPSSGEIPIRVLAPTRQSLPPRPIEAVVLGVSTGGPQALLDLFQHLPSSLPAPVVIVQHMLAAFLPRLAYRLSARGNMTVKMAEPGRPLADAPAWLAPGGTHTAIRRGASGPHLVAVDSPPVNSCRPAADVLFESAAKTLGPAVLGVVMTGMGRDGLLGSRAVVEAGGRVLAQDEPSSVVWGMPGSVAKAGLASATLPPIELAAEIVSQVNRSHRGRKPSPPE